MKLIRVVVFCLTVTAAAWGQCPSGPAFPTAVATDAVLTVAKNNVSTTLLSSMQATDNVAAVTNPTGWVANSMASIDTGSSNEIVFVTAVNGNLLTITRACEGTTAVAHSAGAVIGMYQTAYAGSTAVKAEVKAIETALGANLSNVPGTTSGPSVGVPKGGTGLATVTTNAIPYGQGTSAFGLIAPGSQYQVYQAGTAGVPTIGALQLAQSAAVAGQLGIGNGGTGAATAAAALTALGAPGLSANNTFTGTNTFGAAASFGSTSAFTGTATFNGSATFNSTSSFVGNISAATLALSGNLTTNVTGSTQCLHANISGVISGTGADCGSGGGSSLPSASNQLTWLRVTPNSGNLTSFDWGTLPAYKTSDFNWLQAPGGSLTGGVAATVTLTPCPLGVAGTHTVAGNLPQYLYLQNGTGTAEPVAITGGTCTGDGQTTGTVTFTPANSHTGNWQITSNSQGIQECIYYTGKYGVCRMPSNVSAIQEYGTITIPDGYSTVLMGYGADLSLIACNTTNVDCLSVPFVSSGGGVYLHGFTLDGIGTHTSGALLHVEERGVGEVSDVHVAGGYNGISLEYFTQGATWHDLWVTGFSHIGMWVNCASGLVGCQNNGYLYGIRFLSTADNNVGLKLDAPITGLIASQLWFGQSGNTTNNQAMWLNQDTNSQTYYARIQDSFVDGFAYGVYITGDANPCYLTNDIAIENSLIQSSVYGIAVSGAGACVVTIEGDYLNAANANSPGDAAVFINGASHVNILNNPVVYADGTSCINISGTTSDINISGNTVGVETNGNRCGYAINYAGTTTGSTVIGNPRLEGATGSIIVNGSVSGQYVVKDNPDIDATVPTVAITVGGALNFPYNPTFLTSGTTAITSVTVPSLSAGTIWHFVAGGTTSTSAGATIGNACTLTANKPYAANWDGTKMWFNGPGC